MTRFHVFLEDKNQDLGLFSFENQPARTDIVSLDGVEYLVTKVRHVGESIGGSISEAAVASINNHDVLIVSRN